MVHAPRPFVRRLEFEPMVIGLGRGLDRAVEVVYISIYM
jgi:hypothetical protein